MPAVSVITPSYNRASVIPRAISSLRQQTFDDYEHIIVDDGSTDHTAKVVDAYRDDRTRFIQLTENHGFATAVNQGIDAASGEYISFLDSDDVYYPHRLEITVGAMESHDSSIGGIAHSIERWSEQKSRFHRVPSGMITLRDQADINLIRGTTNTMYRSRVFEEVGVFDEKLWSSVDYDFQLRVVKQFPVIGIDNVLCRKDDTVSGIQDDPSLIRQGLERILEKHGEVLTDRNVTERSFLLGTACLELGDIESAREWFGRAVERSPPNNEMLHYRIGRAYLEADQTADARVHLRASVRDHPTDYRRHVLFWSSFLPTNGAKTVDTLRGIRQRFASIRRESGVQ